MFSIFTSRRLSALHCRPRSGQSAVIALFTCEVQLAAIECARNSGNLLGKLANRLIGQMLGVLLVWLNSDQIQITITSGQRWHQPALI
jgi:hypothetical protein